MRLLGALVLLAGVLLSAPASQAQDQSESIQDNSISIEELWLVAQEEQSLAHLITWCSRLSELDIQFDPERLQDKVRLRVTRMMSGRELWDMTNLALAERGLISVQTPGHEFLTIVSLAEAADLARLEDPSMEDAWAGYVRVLAPVRHARPKDLVGTLSLLVSKEHGMVTVASDSALLVADQKPRVEQVLGVLELLDQPESAVQVESVALEHSSSVDVAALCERVALSQAEISGTKLKGKVLAVAEDRRVLVVAAANEVPLFMEWVRRFDQPEATVIQHYSPRRFGLSETAALVEEVLTAAGTNDPSATWNLVQDALTGTLFVHAAPRQHRIIEDLFRRLESTADSPRRPIRSYPIKHRSAEELLGILQELVDSGALQRPAEQPPVPMGEETVEGPTAPISTSIGARGEGYTGPEVTITVDAGSNRLIAMSEGRVLDQLATLIETLDVPHTEVIVEALVVGLTEGDTLDLAVEMQRLVTDRDEQVRLASLFGLGPVDPGSITLPPASGTGGSAVVLDPGSFSVVVSALETLNEGRTLTMPKILVSNNQQATLDSVLQTPYTSTNASNTVATTSFGGTQDAGTSIQVTPTIAEGDRLILDYTVAISSFVGDSADPNIPPPRQENKLHSVVSVPDGFIVVVGGLEIETESEAFTQVPILGSIPILGALFRSQSTTTSRSRFFVFLRCNVLRDQNFADLKYLSKPSMREAGIDEGWPSLEPRLIR